MLGSVVEAATGGRHAPRSRPKEPNHKPRDLAHPAFPADQGKVSAPRAQMSWASREVFELAGGDGVAFLWRATFRQPGGGPVVEADGMDLAVLRGDLLARNEVYFDRALLAPFMSMGPSGRASGT